jgi:hypothetical protein
VCGDAAGAGLAHPRDAVYLVTARESGGILVTNDAALARQARASAMSSLVTLLSDATLRSSDTSLRSTSLTC